MSLALRSHPLLEHLRVDGVPGHFTEFLVQDDALHILHSTVAFLSGPGIVRCEDAEALYFCAMVVFGLVMVNVPRPPVPKLRLPPFLWTIRSHNERELGHLSPMAMVYPDEDFTMCEIVVVHGRCVDVNSWLDLVYI